jgi:3-hydroxyacyl-[acyl-carrier-protein] dehydratase
MDKILSFDAFELQKYEPNRYPFLYIDRVTECVPGKYAKGYKNLTNNEWFFPIHYKNEPIMPVVLQVEALNQMLTIPFTTIPGNEGAEPLGYKVNATLRKKIRPGDRLDIEAYVTSYSRGLCKGYAKGYVDGELACEVETTMVIPEVFNKYRPKKTDV